MIIKPMYWVKKPIQSAEGEGILRVEMNEGVPLDICVYDTMNYEGIQMGEEASFDFVLQARSIEIFENEEDFETNSDGYREVESFIPVGLFNIKNDARFSEEPTALISGRVIYMHNPEDYGVSEDTSLLNVECLGTVWDVMVDRDVVSCGEIAVGNIISGLMFIIGGPSEIKDHLN